jgi:hypothetical protein
VHVADLAADERFVSLDLAVHLVERLGVNGHPQTVQHEPRGFLGDAQIAGQFVAADAVLAVDEHPHGGQPLREGNRGILED